MSRLSVYWPDELFSEDTINDEPTVLPFPKQNCEAQAASKPMTVVKRAQLLFSNRKCPECCYPVVEPVELSDSTINRSGLAIPGTATLIGFHCCGCEHEWSV